MNKIITLTLIFILTITFCFAQNKITIEDLWKNYAYVGDAPEGVNPMKDGEHYSQMKNSDDGKQMFIVEYSYATGKATDTLVRGSDLIPVDSAHAINATDYVFSDDEGKIRFTTDNEHIYRHSFRANYFVFDLKTKKTTAVSSKGKIQSCEFSPDGSMVAYMRDNNLFVKNLSTQEEAAVTNDGLKNHIINGVCDWVYEEEFAFTTAFQWSPDSKHVAYYRFDESEVPEYTVQFFTDLYPRNYTYKYPKVGEKNSLVSIHIYDIASKQTAAVDAGTETDQYIPRIKWTEDQNQLCVFRMNRWQNKLELLLANASSGKTSVMFTEENKRYIEINDFLKFFNHNQNFIWVSEVDGWMHVYNYSTKGQLVNEITKGEYDVTDCYGLDEKNGIMYYQSAEVSPLERYVYSIKLDGSGKKQITMQHGTNGAEFNPNFTYYMITHSDANTPADYAMFNAKGKQLRVLEDNHEFKRTLSKLELSQQEFFKFTTSDKVSLNGYMIKPTNFNPNMKYPVFMTFYGGPGSQEVLDEWGGFDYMFHEYLAENGYIVVCVDNRGTGARGEEFRKQTYLNLGHDECIDQIETAKYLGTLSFVDKNRIGTFGWSYGGYLSCLCIEKGSDVFKAAVAVAPVTDWKFYDSIYTERYMRDEKENENGYEDNAPMNFADKIKGHFLLIAGLADDNVHYQNTAMLLKSLYKDDIQFDQMTFPDKNHGIYGGNTRYYLFTRISEWVFANL